MIFLNNASSMCAFVLSEVQLSKPTEVIIMTYGLWCGVNKDGNVVNNYCNSYRLMEYLDSDYDIKTIVGVGCDSVVPEVAIGTARCFENIRFVAINRTHSKCVLLSNGIGVFGSANLNDSGWNEVILCKSLDPDSYKSSRDIAMHQIRHGIAIDRDFRNPDISGIIGDACR